MVNHPFMPSPLRCFHLGKKANGGKASEIGIVMVSSELVVRCGKYLSYVLKKHQILLKRYVQSEMRCQVVTRHSWLWG